MTMRERVKQRLRQYAVVYRDFPPVQRALGSVDLERYLANATDQHLLDLLVSLTTDIAA